MDTSKTLIVGLLGTAVLVVGFVFLLGGEQSENSLEQTAEVAEGARHIRGASTDTAGAVTIVEFSDFQCPACRGAQAPLKRLLEKYPHQVRLVYRHFPLSQIHNNAAMAARAAEAAANQDKFWQMHDRLFAEQESWKSLSSDEFVNQLEFYAQNLGLDTEQFKRDLESAEVQTAVEKDLRLANRLGLNSTPTFYVNGRPVKSGGLSFQDWEEEIKPYVK